MVVSGVSGGDQKMGLFFGSFGLLCGLNLLSGMVSYNGWECYFVGRFCSTWEMW